MLLFLLQHNVFVTHFVTGCLGDKTAANFTDVFLSLLAAWRWTLGLSSQHVFVSGKGLGYATLVDRIGCLLVWHIGSVLVWLLACIAPWVCFWRRCCQSWWGGYICLKKWREKVAVYNHNQKTALKCLMKCLVQITDHTGQKWSKYFCGGYLESHDHCCY